MTETATPTSHEAEVEPTEVVHAQRVDVTAVLANIDAAEALRDRIAALKKEYEIHAKIVKDVLGPAVEGTDKSGNVIVRYPFRNRSDLNRELVKSMLSDEEYSRCLTEKQYRTLHFGE